MEVVEAPVVVGTAAAVVDPFVAVVGVAAKSIYDWAVAAVAAVAAVTAFAETVTAIAVLADDLA